MKCNRKLTLTSFSIILFIFIILFFPTWTPKINGDNSIALLESVEINGTELEVMIRGVNRDNPIIIFVHGGPGSSEIPYVRKYQEILEEHFTIVHYDQRGSGKSYHFFEDYSNVSSDQHVTDLLSLTDYVKEEFSKEKVILVGHSYGTYIGIKAVDKDPDKFAAYIGIGQVSNLINSEVDSYNYILSEAQEADNQKDIKKLELIEDSIKKGEMLTPRNMVRKYGGAARLINDNMDYYIGFLTNPEYNFLDVLRYIRGISTTQQILLAEQKENEITTIVTSIDIPMYFVMGKYDYMTSTNSAKTYYETINAPLKEFIIFENSAHYPQFEEENSFAEWLLETYKNLNNL